MSSQSLVSLEDGLTEVRELQRANPGLRKAAHSELTITRAVGRASVVILSSHLEGYIDSLNIEAVSIVNAAPIEPTRLPEAMRLLHSKPAVEALSGTSWERAARAKGLSTFIASDGWLWGSSQQGELEAERLLSWMKSPSPKHLKRYFRYWGIDDIFSRITRASHTRDELWLRLKELVEKRNSIAHGDIATAATATDVSSYLRTVGVFATRVDAVLAHQLSMLCGVPLPW